MDTSLIVALVGVVGTLLASAIAFISNIVIEKNRLSNERKTYISKALFDKEFLLYQALNEKMFHCASVCGDIRSSIEYDLKNPETKMNKDGYYKLMADYLTARNNAFDELGKCAPFIDKEIYNKYIDLVESFRPFAEMLQNFKAYFVSFKVDKSILDDIKNNADEIMVSCKRNQEKMEQQLMEIVKYVREYIHSLEVK